MHMPQTTDLSFGRKLANLRNQRNLTQHQVASAIHIDRSLLSRWENDELSPQIRHVAKLAQFFNVSLAYWD
jgi:transcriptional regulator with XRE-family HTH domain